MTMPTPTLAGFALAGVDAYGSMWTVEQADGVFDRPARRRTRTDRPRQDGVYPARSVAEAPAFRLSGKLLAVDEVGREQSERAARAAVGDGAGR